MIPPVWDVPVTPDADQARQWLTDELAKPDYSTSSSIFEAIMRWLRNLLESFDGQGAPVRNLSIVVVAAAVVIAGVALWRAGPLARRRRVDAAPAALEESDARTAAQILQAARAASADSDWDLALLEYFRAMARSLEERTILDERAGRTAREVVQEACVAFPDAAARLKWAGATFEEVYYGHRPAGGEQCRQLAQLEEQLRATRPVRPRVPDQGTDVEQQAGAEVGAP